MNPEENGQKQKDTHDRRPLVRFITGFAIVLVILLLIGLMPRLARTREVASYANAQKRAPRVNVVAVTTPPPFDDVDLPGNVQAVQQTAVVARASGYVKQWFVDIGDTVRQGQTLATIESPDLDQEVSQARAQLASTQAAYYQAKASLSTQKADLAQTQAAYSRSLATLEQAKTQLAQAVAALAQAQEQSAQQIAQVAQAQANLTLARVTATRYQNLLKDGAIDRQTTDQAVAAYQTNRANVDALQSAVRAGNANVNAFSAAVDSSKANVKAFADDVRSSSASVDAAVANVQSGQAEVDAAAANITSSEDNLNRYVVLQSWENVTAPFPGVITARNVDNGSLISSSGAPTSSDTTAVGSQSAGVTSIGNAASIGNAGSSGGSPASSLFSLAQLNVVRVYVNVPQTYVGTLQVGEPAQVTVHDLPGQTFQGVVTRNAAALDSASRTLVTEVRVPNQKGILRPGMFAEVHLRLPHAAGVLLIPDTALVTNENGNQAVIVGNDDTVHFVPITVGRDFGQVIEVTSGLHAGQRIAQSPSDALRDGEVVNVRDVSMPPPSGGATPPAQSAGTSHT